MVGLILVGLVGTALPWGNVRLRCVFVVILARRRAFGQVILPRSIVAAVVHLHILDKVPPVPTVRDIDVIFTQTGRQTVGFRHTKELPKLIFIMQHDLRHSSIDQFLIFLHIVCKLILLI